MELNYKEKRQLIKYFRPGFRKFVKISKQKIPKMIAKKVYYVCVKIEV